MREWLYLKSPLPNFSIVHKELGDLHILGDGYVELDTASIEVPGHQELSELSIEWAQIRDKARCQGTITCMIPALVSHLHGNFRRFMLCTMQPEVQAQSGTRHVRWADGWVGHFRARLRVQQHFERYPPK